MSDFDFITHKASDFQHFHGSQKEDVHYGRNRHPLSAEERELQRRAVGKLRAMDRELERALRRGDGKWSDELKRRDSAQRELDDLVQTYARRI
ncbi:hypothetical protein [Mesorhizobium sp. STM 4661]|uniref:hypothetical protein n=1 Tax=Mesorhizobium sp. STM 4661 TaxID=1297570 RepID=UPI0002C03EB7|nr:hypothetical protein [Mesorhizobium sp. STM 4661]CCV10576.1 hypothetical protein MESS4_210071 [Mesorhizobium sp. STM 4661]